MSSRVQSSPLPLAACSLANLSAGVIAYAALRASMLSAHFGHSAWAGVVQWTLLGGLAMALFGTMLAWFAHLTGRPRLAGVLAGVPLAVLLGGVAAFAAIQDGA